MAHSQLTDKQGCLEGGRALSKFVAWDVSIYIYIYNVYIYIYIHICIYICMCVYIYIYTHTYTIQTYNYIYIYISLKQKSPADLLTLDSRCIVNPRPRNLEFRAFDLVRFLMPRGEGNFLETQSQRFLACGSAVKRAADPYSSAEYLRARGI